MKVSTLEKFSYKMMKIAKKFLKLAIYFLVMFGIGAYVFNIGVKLFREEAIDDKNTTNIQFEIKTKDTIDDIANNLKQKGLIADEKIFKFRAKLYKTNFKANTYNLNKSMTIKYMLDIFDSAETVAETTVSTSQEEEIIVPENE